MNKQILYRYSSYNLSCQCCSDYDSEYDIWENGLCIEEGVSCPIMCDEEDLRKYLKELEPFDIHPECEWL